MTLSKQGMLIGHSIALTVILLCVVAWKTPSPENAPFRLESQSRAQVPISAVSFTVAQI
jgi:hypothetical protein